jgi:hypothetical protein
MSAETYPSKADITAVREHAIGSRRTRAHVIVCHDLDAKRRTLLDLFRLAELHPEAADAIARELARDIIDDANFLIRDLEAIKAVADRQLAKLPTPLRE